MLSEPFSVKQESPFFVEDPQIVDGHPGDEITTGSAYTDVWLENKALQQ